MINDYKSKPIYCVARVLRFQGSPPRIQDLKDRLYSACVMPLNIYEYGECRVQVAIHDDDWSEAFDIIRECGFEEDDVFIPMERAQ